MQVGALTTWASISIRGASLAVNNDGTLWSWGKNNFGQLGLGNTVYRSSPVQVGTLTTWSTTATGNGHVLAIKTNGTLWAWGKDGYGHLGLGTYYLNKSAPVQVGTLAIWSAVSAGFNGSSAVKTDGTLWVWGNNSNGQLGLGDVIFRSSPEQAGTPSAWSEICPGTIHFLGF